MGGFRLSQLQRRRPGNRRPSRQPSRFPPFARGGAHDLPPSPRLRCRLQLEALPGKPARELPCRDRPSGHAERPASRSASVVRALVGFVVRPHGSIAARLGAEKTLPRIPTLEGRAAEGTYFIGLYPASFLVFTVDCMWWMSFRPITRTARRWSPGSAFPRPRRRDRISGRYCRTTSSGPTHRIPRTTARRRCSSRVSLRPTRGPAASVTAKPAFTPSTTGFSTGSSIPTGIRKTRSARGQDHRKQVARVVGGLVGLHQPRIGEELLAGDQRIAPPRGEGREQ